MKLEIIKAGINGEGIGFFRRKPVFIEGCFPGEIVDCKLYDEGNHYRGQLNAILKKSPHRIKPACKNARYCGGCTLMALDYEEQLHIKKQLLQGALEKYTDYHEEFNDIIPSDEIFHYRNKCNLPVIERDGRLINALYKQGSNHPVFIEDCIVQDEGVEVIRKKILRVLSDHHFPAYDRHERKGIRQLIVRGFDNSYQAVIVTGNDTIDEKTIKDLKQIKHLDSLFQGINTVRDPVKMMPDKLRSVFGKEKIELQSGPYQMRLSPQAFFQLNHQQAERIYEDAAALIKDKKKLIIEAYCGIGAISLHLHDKADKIIGIEVIEKAVKDAKENAKLNHFDNLEFRCADAAQEVRKILKNDKADVLVVDPPRTGLDEELITTILKTKIDQIIYISCNPATLAKNLDLLKERYEIVSMQGYDMFPNTPLVETLVCLKRKR